MITPDRFYRPTQVRFETGAPRDYVYTSLRDGSLRAIRRGRAWLIPGSSVLEWLDAGDMPGRGTASDPKGAA